MVTKECLYYLTFHSSLMHRFVVLVNFMVVLYSPAVAMPSIDAKTVTTSDHATLCFHLQPKKITNHPMRFPIINVIL